jgi:hypothetical protein
VRNLERKKPLERPRCKWENNNNINNNINNTSIGVIKTRMRWAGHVARMVDRKGVYRVILLENPRERDHLEDPGVGGRIILRWIFRKLVRGVMDWIDLAQDRDRWRALVNTVMNIRVT